MNAEQNIIFGINAILEKLKASPGEVVEILLAGEAGGEIKTAADRLGVRVVRGSRDMLDRIALGARHQGAVARVAAFCYRPISMLRDDTASSAKPLRVLILDGITDPRNFGAVLRCADAADAPHVVIPKDRSASVTPTVIKASAGAAHHVNIYRVTNLRQTMKQFKDWGFWLVGLDASAQTSIYDRNYPKRLGIVLGSEGQGMRPLVRRECDFLVSIPMFGKVTSLNVAAAGAVLLYEVLRQARNIDKDGSKR